MTKEILSRFLNNTCSEKEFTEVVRWVNAEALNSKSMSWAIDDWEAFEEDEQYKDDDSIDILLDKIHHKINLDKRYYADSVPAKKALPKLFHFVSRVAAVLFLPVFGLLYYTSFVNPDFNIYAQNAIDSVEVIAPIGSRTVLQLSDGSKVHLNYGSSIKYPQKFIGKTREVLLSGEGFFEVSKNPKKPFIVKTRDINIKAVGTAFNVWAYPDEKSVRTTLVEGKVVLEKLNNGKKKIIGSMVPGQHVVFNRDKGIVFNKIIDVEQYIAWKDGKIIFDNTPINEIARKLERMFNVNIIVSDEIKYLTYNVVIINEHLFQILDLMTLATPIKYKVSVRKKIKNGVFSKQTIFIEKN